MAKIFTLLLLSVLALPKAHAQQCASLFYEVQFAKQSATPLIRDMPLPKFPMTEKIALKDVIYAGQAISKSASEDKTIRYVEVFQEKGSKFIHVEYYEFSTITGTAQVVNRISAFLYPSKTLGSMQTFSGKFVSVNPKKRTLKQFIKDSIQNPEIGYDKYGRIQGFDTRIEINYKGDVSNLEFDLVMGSMGFKFEPNIIKNSKGLAYQMEL